MTPEAFADRFPILWRVSQPGSAEGIRRHGLLTAAQIGARTGVDLAGRRARPVAATLPDGTPITITDNGPLSLRKLATKLEDGLTPEAWLAMLNDRVFFWPDRRIIKGLDVVREVTVRGGAHHAGEALMRMIPG
ncbi:hypothetical protein [uncultured Jannaschia sp.]|uniref:DUF7002 family protein n=1 Tax=uncultured Jannaschia sp. TaxID=293347 RepID=UPI0026212E5C|nr:hypothetical protein [uncultured Jannaschia sp.]